MSLVRPVIRPPCADTLPLTQTKIASMLAEVDVFSKAFEVTRQGRRRRLQVLELEDLERVWSERRS